MTLHGKQNKQTDRHSKSLCELFYFSLSHLLCLIPCRVRSPFSARLPLQRCSFYVDVSNTHTMLLAIVSIRGSVNISSSYLLTLSNVCCCRHPLCTRARLFRGCVCVCALRHFYAFVRRPTYECVCCVSISAVRDMFVSCYFVLYVGVRSGAR